MTDRWVIFVLDRDQLKRLKGEPESILLIEEALYEVSPTGSGSVSAWQEKISLKTTAYIYQANIKPSSNSIRVPKIQEWGFSRHDRRAEK